jgi:hypothetical protein
MPALVYDRAAHHAMEQAVVGGPTPYNFFYYPPVFLLLCSLLAKLPYVTALILFEAATLAAFLWVGRQILADRKPIAIVVLLAFPPVAYNILLGQNALLTASLFGMGFLLLEQRPILAGLILGAICYKPHYGLLLPVAFVASRNWKTFAAAAGSVATLIALSLLQFGWDTWAAYLGAAAGSHISYESGAVDIVGLATPFGASRALGLPSSWALSHPGSGNGRRYRVGRRRLASPGHQPRAAHRYAGCSDPADRADLPVLRPCDPRVCHGLGNTGTPPARYHAV